MDVYIKLKETRSLLKSPILPCDDGEMKEKLHLSNKENLDTEDTILLTFLKQAKEKEEKEKKEEKELKSVIVEYQVEIKKDIFNVKLNICETNSPTTQSLKITVQVLTSRGKVLKPFWTTQSKLISKKLWLPTKKDCADLDLTSSSKSSKKPQILKSWFSMKNLKSKTRTCRRSLVNYHRLLFKPLRNAPNQKDQTDIEDDQDQISIE